MLKETYNRAIIMMSRFADGVEMSRTLVGRCLCAARCVGTPVPNVSESAVIYFIF